MARTSRETCINAKPFLKWAGGKKQLLFEFNSRLPLHMRNRKSIESYVEPFVGGGAMFFFLKRHYRVRKSSLFDVNRELIMAYKVVKNDCKALIEELKEMEDIHLEKSEEARKKNYYAVRKAYNLQMDGFGYEDYNDGWIKRTSYMIFLNKTCFNGLFRQNMAGKFNVPFGRYKNPTICDETNLTEVARALKTTEIFCGDFTQSEACIENGSFVYLDPPYRPLNRTSNFTEYCRGGFADPDQIKLANFFEEMDKRGAYLMLSNSDPKNEDPQDEFFDNLYRHYNTERVDAKRNINSDASRRGNIKELIVRNYMH
jgi:DNA adenine methylase